MRWSSPPLAGRARGGGHPLLQMFGSRSSPLPSPPRKGEGIAAALIAVLLCTSVHATESEALPKTSLFFSEDETRQIEVLSAKIKPPKNDGSGIHLGAVIYYGPENWTLWLQGAKWTPATDRPDLHVVSVTPSNVQLSWQRNAKAPLQEITLHPYQTYHIMSGRVVEGLR